MEPAIYILRFFYDMNNDFRKDFYGLEVILEYNLYCEGGIF